VEYSQEGIIDVLHLSFKGDIHSAVLQIYTTAPPCGPNGIPYGTGTTRTIRHEHSIVLFNFNKTLVNDPWKLPSDVYEWPFEFIFPELTQPLNQENPFPLPPAFSEHQGGSFATIKYEVVAHLQYKGLSNAFDPVETSVSLSFRCPGRPPVESKLIAHFLEAQCERDRRFRPKPHTFQQSLLHYLTMREDLRTPCVRFVPIVWLPDALTVGREFSITIVIDYIRERLADPEGPEFVLKGLSVELSYYSKWGRDDRVSGSVDRASILYMNPNVEEPLPIEKTRPTVISGIRMPREGLQCFHTPLVKRSAWLRVTAVVCCRSLCYPPADAKPFHFSLAREVEVMGQPDKQAANGERSVRLSSSMSSFGSTVRRYPMAN